MKRNHLKRVIAVLGFSIFLIVAAAGSAGAHPTQTLECGTSGCHDTHGVLTIMSNSTSLDAQTGDSFVLNLQAGNGAEWIAIRSSWANNSQFIISQDEVEDGSTNDTNAASGAISVLITFTPLAPGNQTIRIWTAAGGDLATSLNVVVNVTGQGITTTTGTTLDLVWVWSIMIIAVPVSVGVILLLLGVFVFRRRA